MLVPNPHKSWAGDRQQSHGQSKASAETKHLEKPVLQCFCIAAGPAQGPDGLVGSWKGSGGLGASTHAAQQESKPRPVQAFVTVHMQHAVAEDHCSSVSSVSGTDLKTAPSQRAFKAISWARAPEERKCR